MIEQRDPLARPNDWVSFEEQWRSFDRSKVVQHVSKSNLKYWVEPYGPKILTDDPEIHLSFHGWGAQDYEGYSYALLHHKGDVITITSEPGNSGQITFSYDIADQTPEGAQVWHVDCLFQEFDVPDHEQYPWVTLAEHLPTKRVSGISVFRNRAHQTEIVDLIATLLSCHNGNVMAALRGELTQGKVVFGEKLVEKLEAGSLIV